MAFGIYKSDQGYWTRVMSSIALGVLALTGAAWLWGELAAFNNVFVQGGGVLLLVAMFGALIYWLFGLNRKTVEFFIATESELKKVNWSTRKEILGSTWVVIIVSLAITIVLYVVDLIFSEVFKMAGVLVGDSLILDLLRSFFGET